MNPTNVMVQVPAVLRGLAGGAATVEVQQGTVEEALRDLQCRYPALARAISTEAGTIRHHVNVFLNQQDIRQLDGVRTVLRPGDTVVILPSISGG